MTRFYTPEERRLLDHARPSERVVIRDLYELLDARLVTEGAQTFPRPNASASPPDAGSPLRDEPAPPPTLFDDKEAAA